MTFSMRVVLPLPLYPAMPITFMGKMIRHPPNEKAPGVAGGFGGSCFTASWLLPAGGALCGLAGGGLDGRDVLLHGVVELLVDRREVVVGALGRGHRGLHVADDAFAAGRRVLEGFLEGGDRGLVELGGVRFEDALHFLARAGGRFVCGARVRVGAPDGGLDG